MILESMHTAGWRYYAAVAVLVVLVATCFFYAWGYMIAEGLGVCGAQRLYDSDHLFAHIGAGQRLAPRLGGSLQLGDFAEQIVHLVHRIVLAEPAG